MSEVMRACLEYRRALREFDRQKLIAIMSPRPSGCY